MFDQLPVAYNKYVLTQKRAAMAIDSWKLTRAHTGAIKFKGSGRIRMLLGVKG